LVFTDFAGAIVLTTLVDVGLLITFGM